MPVRNCSILLAASLLAACGSKGTKARGGGELTAEWLGADTGGISVKPTATWCKVARQFRVTAIKGEVGVSLLISPVDSLTDGYYPIFDPGIDTAMRPGAAAVSRLIRDKSVVAYQSDSGMVQVASTPTGAGATFTVRLRGLNTTDTVRMTGHFGGVSADACPDEKRVPPGPPG